MTDEVEDFLAHYGVKGMKWGVRKDRAPGVSRKVDRDASKDAKEFARAKAFYGEGAGNRRKLIKSKVAYKSKTVPGYKKAFDHHSGKQDLNKHADKAVKERKRTDRKTRNKQRRGAVARRLTGEWGTQAAFVALAAGGTAYLASPAGKQLRNRTMSSLRTQRDNLVRRRGAQRINSFLRDQL